MPFSPSLAAYSYNGSYVAFLLPPLPPSTTSTIVVSSSDLASVITRFDLPSLYSSPTSLEWCGSDAVVACYPLGLGVLGPYGDWHFQDLDLSSPPFPHLTRSGLRISTRGGTVMLHRVPGAITDMYAPGSIHPASLLVSGEGTSPGGVGDEEAVEAACGALIDVHGPARMEVANAVRGRREARDALVWARVVGTLERR